MTYALLGTGEQGNLVHLSQSSRREGMYIIGATGTGKSTLIENLILQDIEQDMGVCVFEPHRRNDDLTMRTIERMEYLRLHAHEKDGRADHKKREKMERRLKEDVIFLDIRDAQYVFGLNLFHCENPSDPFEEEDTVSRVMHVLEKVYDISRGTPQMNQYFLNITRTLLYNPQCSVLDIPRLLTNDAFRRQIVQNVPDEHVRWFWEEFFQNRKGFRRDD